MKINEFIKSVVSGRTTDESENEGWQRNNVKPDDKRDKGKKHEPK